MNNSPKVGFVSLGCPKALVDSERIITQLRAEGYELVSTYNKADLVVVNTCGFINAAIEESLDAIGDALQENGKVIVTGCLGAKSEIIREKYPNVLNITGPHAYEDVLGAVHQHLPAKHDPFVSLIPPGGIKLTPRHYAYLKIAEGCNHKCTFCIIPSMRGRLVSRPINEVMVEAEKLVKAGVKELLVISQDTSAYGIDKKYQAHTWHNKEYQTSFMDLCRGLGELGAWVRLHYVYPYPHVDNVISLMAERKILPYLDIPFQHASPRILKAMKRPAASEKNIDRILKWREICPDITIRSTFIVGFPGETESEFMELLEFIKIAELDRVGCFQYSPVAGAKANDLPGHVPEEVKLDRYQRFMELQTEISQAKLKKKIGRDIEVIVDAIEDNTAIARSHADAPEIDGLVYFPATGHIKIGQLYPVKIESTDEHDLYGKLVEQ